MTADGRRSGQSASTSSERVRVEHLLRPCPAAPRGRDRERHVPEAADRVRVGRADDLQPGAQRVADVLAAQVEPGGQAVDLERDPLLERDRVDPLEVDGVLGPAADQPPRRMAEAAHVRVAQRLLDAPGHLRPRHPLPAVHARLDPVELGEHVVGQVEPAVGQDVALDPAQDAERRQPLVRGRDLLGLAADVVGREPRNGADGRRVVADRDVVVAALERGAAHLLDARAAVGPRRVAVQVAADVGDRDQRRRLAAERRLAQLRRAPRHAERAEQRLLVGRVRQRLERRDVRRASRSRARARSRTAPARPRPARPARPRR